MTTASPEDDALARLRDARIVPVIVIDDPADAVPLARALAAGGLACAEITFRTPRAADSLRRIAAEVPELFPGAGTVLTVEQARAARDAGARFIVSPGFGTRVVDYCLEHDLSVYPGVCTPTEVQAALDRGLTTLKFFPAEQSGGLAFLQAMAAPYAGVRFMPTGGINANNVASYLAFDRVIACGGSWMAPADWIAGHQFERIREVSRQAVAAARGGPRAVAE